MDSDRDDLARYETGSRKYELRPDLKQPDPLETGDPADRPKRPFGLAEEAERPKPAVAPTKP